METTSTRAEGGKSPRPTRPRSVLQAREALPKVAAPPYGDRVAIAIQFRRDVQIGRAIRVSSPQDHPNAKRKGLGCRTGTDQRLQLFPLFFLQRKHRGKRVGHGERPCYKTIGIPASNRPINPNPPLCLYHLLLSTHLRNGHLVWFDEAGRQQESLDNERPVGELLLTQFHRAVTSLLRKTSDLDDACRALAIVDQARRSHLEGRRIELALGSS